MRGRRRQKEIAHVVEGVVESALHARPQQAKALWLRSHAAFASEAVVAGDTLLLQRLARVRPREQHVLSVVRHARAQLAYSARRLNRRALS